MEDKLDLLGQVRRVPHGNSLPEIMYRIAERRNRIPRQYMLVAATLLLLLFSADVLAALEQKNETRRNNLNALLPMNQTWSYDE
jgi:hypothetical protein